MADKKGESGGMLPRRYEERFRGFFDELSDPDRNVIDGKRRELIALSAALAGGWHLSVPKYIKAAAEHGASFEEVGETIALAIGISAAAIVDQTDIVNMEEDLVGKLWGRDESENNHLPMDGTTP